MKSSLHLYLFKIFIQNNSVQNNMQNNIRILNICVLKHTNSHPGLIPEKNKILAIIYVI